MPTVDIKDLLDDGSRHLRNARRAAGGGFAVLLALLLLTALLLATVRIGRVRGTEIGIMLNKLSGKMTIIPESGVRFYNGLTNEFFVLDKTLQTLIMTESAQTGELQERDDLKIKTIDGSDVYVDLKVQYRIIPEMADVVIRASGPGDAYKTKWARDYTRSTCRNYLGELTTEEFYDSSLRDVKVTTALKETNKLLAAYGLVVETISIPRKPHFYAEYEEMIKKKKLADQAVLEEQSKALAAQQKQQTLMVTETNKKNVAVKEFEGQMEQKIISARADAEKIGKEADAYFDRVTIGAEAALYAAKKQAEAILAEKSAEAKGIEALKQALEGEGGRNMVKMEYARKLKDIIISGKPYTIDGRLERFEHLFAPQSDIPVNVPAVLPSPHSRTAINPSEGGENFT